MADRIPIVLYGFGFIGRMLAKALLKLKHYDIVGVVDINPKILGCDIGELLNIGKIGVKVSNDPVKVLSERKPKVVLHATASFLDQVFPQLKVAIEHRANIISSCETLAYPWLRYPKLAKEIDKLARKFGVTVIGAGVNPGFIFDLLPAIISGACLMVKKIRVVRRINALKRRPSFQRKIGLGLTLDEFRELMSKGVITGHVGYAESIMLVGKVLGRKISKVVEKQEPIVRNGKVEGIKGQAVGYCDRKVFVRLEFIASASVKDQDAVIIDCENYKLKWVSNGTPGDQATVSVMINLIPTILKSTPGLRTIADYVPFSRPIL